MKRILIVLSFFSIMACQNQVDKVPDDTTTKVSNNGSSWTGLSYKTYYNDRFGYRIDYPSVMSVSDKSSNGDGRTFSYGGLTITVFGSYNALFTNVQEQFKENCKPTDTYKVVKSNWYVCSGVDSKGFVYYEKSILKNDIWYTVILEYPKSMKEDLDEVVTRVVNSFKIT